MIVERNLANASDMVRHLSERRENIVIACQPKNTALAPGIWVDNELKNSYASYMQNALTHGLLGLDGGAFTQTHQNVKAAIAELRDELINLSRCENNTSRYTGKHNDMQDDLAIAGLMAVYFAQKSEAPACERPFRNVAVTYGRIDPRVSSTFYNPFLVRNGQQRRI